jgi:dGTP triphosphohydrolase
MRNKTQVNYPHLKEGDFLRKMLKDEVMHSIEVWGGYRSIAQDVKRSRRKFKLAKMFKKHKQKKKVF